MSTWIYLRCEDHTPPLTADAESGQHLYNLPQIRADIANRDAIVAAVEDGFITDDYFRRHTARFLIKHPKCRLSIQDEYGVEHPLVDDGAA